MAEETENEQGKKDTGRLHCCTVFTDHRCLLFWSILFYKAFPAGNAGKWFLTVPT